MKILEEHEEGSRENPDNTTTRENSARQMTVQKRLTRQSGVQ
jgi:hypothetical protein